jgi:hypothetical protein
MLFIPDVFTPYVKGRELAIEANWADRARYLDTYNAELDARENTQDAEVRDRRQPGLLEMADTYSELGPWVYHNQLQDYGLGHISNRQDYYKKLGLPQPKTWMPREYEPLLGSWGPIGTQGRNDRSSSTRNGTYVTLKDPPGVGGGGGFGSNGVGNGGGGSGAPDGAVDIGRLTATNANGESFTLDPPTGSAYAIGAAPSSGNLPEKYDGSVPFDVYTFYLQAAQLSNRGVNSLTNRDSVRVMLGDPNMPDARVDEYIKAIEFIQSKESGGARRLYRGGWQHQNSSGPVTPLDFYRGMYGGAEPPPPTPIHVPGPPPAQLPPEELPTDGTNVTGTIGQVAAMAVRAAARDARAAATAAQVKSAEKAREAYTEPKRNVPRVEVSLPPPSPSLSVGPSSGLRMGGGLTSAPVGAVPKLTARFKAANGLAPNAVATLARLQSFASA